MTLVVDTGPLVASLDANDPRGQPVRAVLLNEPGRLLVPAAVVAEADHLAGRRLGRHARLALLEDLAEGPYEVVPLEAADLHQALDVDRQYADLDLGLADATIIVTAHRFETTRLLTFDERDLRVVTPLQGGAFVLLPGDGH